MTRDQIRFGKSFERQSVYLSRVRDIEIREMTRHQIRLDQRDHQRLDQIWEIIREIECLSLARQREGDQRDDQTLDQIREIIRHQIRLERSFERSRDVYLSRVREREIREMTRRQIRLQRSLESQGVNLSSVREKRITAIESERHEGATMMGWL